jgi:UDP-N-acetyl-2-amino-2-deoxyglucuronate dehydrogenase
MTNFAIVGVAGYVAPRHLDAIESGGNRVLAAVDPCDSVGLLDRYSSDARYFRDLESFSSFVAERRRGGASGRVDWISICSPNDLHEEHLRIALRCGADAICEKPLVIDPRRLDALEALERETGRRIFAVLQLRHHPALRGLRERLAAGEGAARRKAEVELTYVTARGPWYDVSWKGSEERSGGLALNVGIHLFDLLLWLFGPVEESEVHLRGGRRAAGRLRLRRANVRWFLSLDRANLPAAAERAGSSTFRSLTVDGLEVDFSSGFGELHRRVYEAVLSGTGCGLHEARPSLELAHSLRSARITAGGSAAHPLAEHGALSR